jgi:hypothetical protein
MARGASLNRKCHEREMRNLFLPRAPSQQRLVPNDAFIRALSLARAQRNFNQNSIKVNIGAQLSFPLNLFQTTLLINNS